MSVRSYTSCSSRHFINPSAVASAVFWIKTPDGFESFSFDDANPLLIGSSPSCDLQIKAKGVFPKHALIEYHPITRSFWLRDLHTSSQGGALGHTVCNSRPVYGMVNLKTNDKLRFGDSAEHLFEMMPAIVQKPHDKPYSSSAQKRQTTSSSGSSDSIITLPIVGQRIYPKDHRERFVKPAVVNQRLCRLKNVPRLVDAGKSLSLATEQSQSNELKRSGSLSDTNSKKSGQRKSKRNAEATPESEQQTSGRLDRWTDLGVSIDSSVSTGNQLVQRIVRLQNELHRKELEIAQLREKNHQTTQTLPQLTSENTETSKDETPNELSKSQEKLNEIVYSTFFAVSCDEIEQINKKFAKNGSIMSNYGDIFGEAYRLLQEPFSYRLMEINTKCSAIFKKSSYKTEEKEELYNLLDFFFRDRLNPISKAFDAFLPILKEASAMARESIKACSVFSQWSREFGDQLQLNPNSEHMLFKVDDLQSRFREHNLGKFWLFSSLSPLLKILIYEYKTKQDELIRQGKEHSLTVKFLKDQIAELEMKLNSNHPLIVEQNIDDEVAFLRSENEALKFANAQLEERLKREDSEDVVPIERVRREDRPRTAVGMRSSPTQFQMESTIKQQSANTYETCSRPSSQEEIDTDDEELLTGVEASAKKTPDLQENEDERSYNEDSQSEIEPEVSKKVVGLERMESAQEGACESKGSKIRDCRNVDENQGEENKENGNNEEQHDEDKNDDNEDRESNNQHPNDSEKEEEKSEKSEHKEVESNRSIVSESNENQPIDEEAPLTDVEDELESEIKDTQETDADIDPDILDQPRRLSEPAIHSTTHHYDEERQQNAIEFWNLAQLLAEALNVQLPDHEESDFSAIDACEGFYVEKHRRELTVNAIMEKIRDILDRIRSAEDKQRGITSRQQSVRSNKSIEEESFTKSKSASISEPSSRRIMIREVPYNRIDSIIEGESDL